MVTAANINLMPIKSIDFIGKYVYALAHLVLSIPQSIVSASIGAKSSLWEDSPSLRIAAMVSCGPRSKPAGYDFLILLSSQREQLKGTIEDLRGYQDRL